MRYSVCHRSINTRVNILVSRQPYNNTNNRKAYNGEKDNNQYASFRLSCIAEMFQLGHRQHIKLTPFNCL